MPDASVAEYRRNLARRVERQKAFHGRREPGDLLVYASWDRGASLEGFLCGKLHGNPVEQILDPVRIPAMIREYADLMRDSRPGIVQWDDDIVPTALVYWGIGGINAAMTGLEPLYHDGFTSWLEPNLEWERLASLRFEPDNRWVQFALHVNQALWDLWEEDFHILPFLHRSPLDAANGIRGTELFAEMHTDPERVKRLIAWCVEWQVSMERYLAANGRRRAPPGWGTAVWGTWLPDGAVFVNGDPVGLISRSDALEFEQPYTARLFAQTGGGFYHNHTVGLYQADLVCHTPGTFVQFYVNDPKQPTGPEALLDHPALREKLLAASLETPIGLAGVPANRLQELLDIARHGRFILAVGTDPEKDDPAGMVRTVRAASRLG